MNKKTFISLIIMLHATMSFAEENMLIIGKDSRVIDADAAKLEIMKAVSKKNRHDLAEKEKIKKEIEKARVHRRYSYVEAKRVLYGKVQDETTFYTSCKIWPGFTPKPNLPSCNLENFFDKKHAREAKKIDVDHVIDPKFMFRKNGKLRKCYEEAASSPGRALRYCKRNDKEFKSAYADMINLVPDIKPIIRKKKKKNFGMVTKVEEIYSNTGVYAGKKYFQPPQNKAGDIARIAFYMHWKYGATYSRDLVKTFLEWNKVDPVSKEEIDRNNKIIKAQGWGNPYVVK